MAGRQVLSPHSLNDAKISNHREYVCEYICNDNIVSSNNKDDWDYMINSIYKYSSAYDKKSVGMTRVKEMLCFDTLEHIEESNDNDDEGKALRIVELYLEDI